MINLMKPSATENGNRSVYTVSVELGDGAPKIILRNASTGYERFTVPLTPESADYFIKMLNVAKQFMDGREDGV